MIKRAGIILSLILNLTVVIMEIYALVISLNSSGTDIFVYYTDDSNILGMLACAITVLSSMVCLVKGYDVPRWVRTIKYMAVCCLLVTFIVVVTILAPMVGMDGYRMMLLEGTMLYKHFLCPIIVFISFMLFERKPAINRKDSLIAMIPTLIYATIIIILNFARVIEGPYPFLQIYRQPMLMSCMWFILIIGGAYIIALLVRLFNKIGIKNE